MTARRPVEWFVLNAEANVEIDMTAADALEQLRGGRFTRDHLRDGPGQAGPARRLVRPAWSTRSATN